MIKKKTILTIVFLVIAVITIIVWVISDSNKLKSMDTTNIKEITIINPAKYFTITEKDDIQLLFNTLQSMKLRRTLNIHKDGFTFLRDIELKSGNIIHMSILSGDINIDGHNYQPDKDYCDILSEIFNNLSKKYEINHLRIIMNSLLIQSK